MSRTCRFALCAVLAAFSASAQEIGKEIPDVAPAGPKSSLSTAPAVERGVPVPAAAELADGPSSSARKGAFGIRASFSGGGSVTPSGTGITLSYGYAPSVGVSYFITDGFTLLFDAAFALAAASGGDTAVGFGASVGFDLHFRSPQAALRPLFTFQAGITRPILAGEGLLGLDFRVGGGAEYFLSPQFSLSGKVLVDFPLLLVSGNALIILSTLTPAVGAAFYF